MSSAATALRSAPCAANTLTATSVG
jgi:hypothetical protein